MNKLILGLAVAALMMGFAVMAPGTPLALAGSGSGHREDGDSGSGRGGDGDNRVRIETRVQNEFDDDEFGPRERIDIRNADGSRVREETRQKVEDGMLIIETRREVRDAFGNKTETRTEVPVM